MPDFEFEYSEQDKDLILTQSDATFLNTDYIRLTIYPEEAINNIVDLPTKLPVFNSILQLCFKSKS